MKNRDIFLRGLLKENPVLVMLLGTCPTLAVTTMAVNGIGMGLATTFVLLGSNIVISLLKRIIPKEVRLPCYIVIIAGFVTLVGFLLERYVPALNQALGLFLSLITVNCIILGRAEMFASKNSVGHSILDALGMGFGFTLALFCMGAVRELIGAGTIFGLDITFGVLEPMLIFILPAGGFFVFGCLIALVNVLTRGRAAERRRQSGGCAGCPAAGHCSGHGEEVSQ